MENFLKAKEILEAELKNKTQIGVKKSINHSEIVDNLNETFSKELPEAKVEHGMSKFTIIFDNDAQVMKVPFNGYWEDYYDDNKEYQSEWKDFKNATEESPFDYCLSELNKYQKAVECDVAVFFAAITLYDNTEDGYPLYSQEKVYLQDEITIPTATEESLNYVKAQKEINSNWEHLPENWIALAVDKYGKESVESFINFISYIEPEILDVNNKKYAYRLDGSPVLFDFSGYRE